MNFYEQIGITMETDINKYQQTSPHMNKYEQILTTINKYKQISPTYE